YMQPALRLERLDRLAHRWSAHLEQCGEITFGRQPITWLEVLGRDQVEHLPFDPVGNAAVLADLLPHVPSRKRSRHHNARAQPRTWCSCARPFQQGGGPRDTYRLVYRAMPSVASRLSSTVRSVAGSAAAGAARSGPHTPAIASAAFHPAGGSPTLQA